MYISVYVFEIGYCQKPISKSRVPVSMLRVTAAIVSMSNFEIKINSN